MASIKAIKGRIDFEVSTLHVEPSKGFLDARIGLESRPLQVFFRLFEGF